MERKILVYWCSGVVVIGVLVYWCIGVLVIGILVYRRLMEFLNG